MTITIYFDFPHHSLLLFFTMDSMCLYHEFQLPLPRHDITPQEFFLGSALFTPWYVSLVRSIFFFFAFPTVSGHRFSDACTSSSLKPSTSPPTQRYPTHILSLFVFSYAGKSGRSLLCAKINQIGFKFMYSQFTGIKFYSTAYRLKLNEVISNISRGLSIVVTRSPLYFHSVFCRSHLRWRSHSPPTVIFFFFYLYTLSVISLKQSGRKSGAKVLKMCGNISLLLLQMKSR